MKLTSGDWAVLKLLIVLTTGETSEDFPIPEEEDVASKRRQREEDNVLSPSPPSCISDSSSDSKDKFPQQKNFRERGKRIFPLPKK